jgi:aminomethyltransferase
MAETIESMVKRTPLYDSQKELGARFADFYGWQMAQSYTGDYKEYQSVRNGVGLFDLSYYGVIKIGGKEAIQFLNGLLTNDVKALSKGKGMRAAFLTGHGKVRALCRVLSLGDEYLIINAPQTHDKVFKYIFPFSYAGDFKVDDVSDQYRVLSVQGPKSDLVMKEICFEPIPSLAEYEWITNTVAGQTVLIANASHTGEKGFDILAPTSGLKDVWDFILLKGSFHSITPVGMTALDSLRIEAGIPVYGVDIDENNMMLEVGLADAVSFTKGCYTGQEAVAMATYRGHVSKRLSGLVIASETIPEIGDKLFKDSKEIGHITSAMKSETLGAVIALAYVKYGFFDEGNTLEVETQARRESATVVKPPFYSIYNGRTNNTLQAG